MATPLSPIMTDQGTAPGPLVAITLSDSQHTGWNNALDFLQSLPIPSTGTTVGVLPWSSGSDHHSHLGIYGKQICRLQLL